MNCDRILFKTNILVNFFLQRIQTECTANYRMLDLERKDHCLVVKVCIFFYQTHDPNHFPYYSSSSLIFNPPFFQSRFQIHWNSTIQWNFCNPTPKFSDILWPPTKIYGPKVFLLFKMRPEYSDILCNPTHFPGSLVCRIRKVPLYY